MLEEKLLKKIYQNVEVDEKTLCFKYTGGTNGKQYGRMYHEKKSHGVHRLMYQVFFGEIPPNKEVHHTCSMRSCCNPAHLELLSHRMNVALQAKSVALRTRRLRNLVNMLPKLVLGEKICSDSSELQHILQCRSNNVASIFSTMGFVYGEENFQWEVVVERHGKPLVYELQIGSGLLEQLDVVEDESIHSLLDSLLAVPTLSAAD